MMSFSNQDTAGGDMGDTASRVASSAPPKRNRMSAAARRGQLAEAAARQFHHRGFHRVTMVDVASAVDISPPAIYRHFANKQALLYAAIESGIARVEDVLAESPAATWPERIEGVAA